HRVELLAAPSGKVEHPFGRSALFWGDCREMRPTVRRGEGYREASFVLVFRDHSFHFFESDSLLAPVREVRHMRRDRRLVTELDWRIWSFATAHALDPIGHVILVLGLSCQRSSARSVHIFRIVADIFSFFSACHLGSCPSMLDRAIASQNALAEIVVAIAKRGLPRPHQVVREIESDDNCVRYFAAILF